MSVQGPYFYEGDSHPSFNVYDDHGIAASVYAYDKDLDATERRAFVMDASSDLLAACKAALKQLRDLDDVLNQPGHEVIGWHLNGASEPVSSFFEDNDCGAIEPLEAAISKAEQP